MIEEKEAIRKMEEEKHEIEVIIDMLRDGYNIKNIQILTGLSKKKIKMIRKNRNGEIPSEDIKH